MATKTVFALCLLAAVCALALGGPIHASCKMTWTFTAKCGDINGKIMAQIAKWGMSYPCGTSEKCKYKVTGTPSDSRITATHTTPVKMYVDDLTFDFKDSGSGCTVNCFSTSETWYAVLDYGTNYCNLRNLADGAGISTSAYGFQETATDSTCTQYSSRNCSKY